MKTLLWFNAFMSGIILAAIIVSMKHDNTPLLCDIVAMNGKPIVMCVKYNPEVADETPAEIK